MQYTKADILKDFDSNGGKENPYKFFPTLQNAYTIVSSNKIHLYADNNKWAVVFEVNGYDTMRYCIEKTHHYFGNCLNNLDHAGLGNVFLCNTKYFTLSSEEDLMKVSQDFEEVLETAKSIKLRNIEIDIEHNIDDYKAMNIPLNNDDNIKKTIDIPAMTRMINYKNPDIFNSTEDELRTCIPGELRKIMTINEWYHVDCYRVSAYENQIPLPSSIETFQLIAEVLVTKDINKYKPSKQANSHWSNWNSGFL